MSMKEKVINYLRETQSELKQMTWPTKDELVGSTIITIAVTLVLAFFIYAVDKLLELVIFSVLNLRT